MHVIRYHSRRLMIIDRGVWQHLIQARRSRLHGPSHVEIKDEKRLLHRGRNLGLQCPTAVLRLFKSTLRRPRSYTSIQPQTCAHPFATSTCISLIKQATPLSSLLSPSVRHFPTLRPTVESSNQVVVSHLRTLFSQLPCKTVAVPTHELALPSRGLTRSYA